MSRIDDGEHWKPSSNLHVWNYNINHDVEKVGTQFLPPNSDCVNYGVLYGNEIAKANPKTNVYVINISKGGTNLKQWLADAKPPNMWNAIERNTGAALSTISDKYNVDEIIWWGHESDASSEADVSANQFIEDFQKIFNKVDKQSWANQKPIPIRFHRLHPDSNTLSGQINFALENIVLNDPGRFSLIDTTAFSYSDGIHLDGKDKQSAAIHAFKTERPGTIACREVNPNLIKNTIAKSSVKYLASFLRICGKPRYWISAPTDTSFTIRENVGYLNPKSSIYQKIDFSEISGSVLTVSMECKSSSLVVSICNQKATILAGSGRRQASVKIPKQYIGERHVALHIINTGDDVAGLSKIKLEIGGANTAFCGEEWCPVN